MYLKINTDGYVVESLMLCILGINCSLFISLLCYFYVSQFTVETYCFDVGRCLFKQPQSGI